MKTSTKLRNGTRVRFVCAIGDAYPLARGLICDTFLDGNARFYELTDVSLWYRAKLARAGIPDARVIRAARDIIE